MIKMHYPFIFLTQLRSPSEYSSARRFSLFNLRRGSRNTSIISLSTASGPPSRKVSRIESNTPFSSIIESDFESFKGAPRPPPASVDDTTVLPPPPDTLLEEEDPVSRNVADNGHLPNFPPPILGPMSHVQDRAEGDNFEVIDVYKSPSDTDVVPKDNAAGGPSSTNDDSDPNNNLGIDNPIYASNDSIAAASF